MPTKKNNNLPLLDADQLRNRLRLKSLLSERQLLENHEEANKFFKQYQLRPGYLRKHTLNLITSGFLAGTLFLSPPAPLPNTNNLTPHTITVATSQTLRQSLAKALAVILPSSIKPLTPSQEEEISRLLKEIYGINATASLDGNKLLQSYGRMGAEQHLPRWPGDTAAAHELPEKGITPGLGAWGYVGDSLVEKYYVAVQTLYLPNWLTETQRLSRWYKFRRVVVINPANGKVIIAAIADAGPAAWTGKHFGGSPEVMQYLEINYGKQNHPVILFFLDDKDNKVPLGPVEYNVETGNPALKNKA